MKSSSSLSSDSKNKIESKNIRATETELTVRFHILTLFPDSLKPFLESSILGRAQKEGRVEFQFVQIRDYAQGRHRTVDEPPFGGGEGMVMKADVLEAALLSVTENLKSPAKVVFLSPQGQVLTQEMARFWMSDLAHGTIKEIVLVCGHYEGIDERFIEKYVDLEVSIGDYVLTGGELPALVLIDVLTRVIPGVVGNSRSIEEETFEKGLLKYPQYTKPREFAGVGVPEVLLSGNHSKIAKWREEKMLERTRSRRPDLFEAYKVRSKSKQGDQK